MDVYRLFVCRFSGSLPLFCHIWCFCYLGNTILCMGEIAAKQRQAGEPTSRNILWTTNILLSGTNQEITPGINLANITTHLRICLLLYVMNQSRLN